MSTKAKRIRVFLSSPGNLQEDRKIVKRVIDEINIDTGSRYGYFIELITWETHTYPAAGTHPQDVINKQIPESIDIFLGLMGHYFGTPTSKWNSGTEEEFRIAHASYSEHNRPEIMFYFSDFVKSTRDINSKQLGLVEEFRNELGNLGLLYGSYQELSEFSFLVRRHLSACISSILKKEEVSESALEEHSFSSEIQSDYPFYDSLLLDDVEIAAQVHLDNATQDLNTLTHIMETLNRRSKTFTKELIKSAQKIDSGNNTNKSAKVQEGLAIASDSSHIFDRNLRDFIKDFRVSFENLVGNLQRYFIVISESDVPEKNERLIYIVNNMANFMKSISNLKESIKDTISAITSWPSNIEMLRIRKEILSALFMDLDTLFKNSLRLGEDYCSDVKTKIDEN